MSYQPSQKILEKYAGLLVNFALRDGKGMRKGEVVYIACYQSAKPIFIELQKAVLGAGGHYISKYIPDDDEKFTPAKDFYELANDAQLKFFPRKYLKGLIDQIDHSIFIISEKNKTALKEIDPKKIMTKQQATKPYFDWRDKKERIGKFSWTGALYGTREMAQAANLSLREYWNQIIKACFLDEEDPIKKWKAVAKKIKEYQEKLNKLEIEKLHIKGRDADLWIKLGRKRHWRSGAGSNIPSFEIFTSPDWRDTEGWIRFNQPLYRYGNLIKGIELEFKKGRVVRSKARQNEKLLKEITKIPGGNQLGEFSLTDSGFSRISKFMAETLYDENVGGKYGNTHIALGMSIKDCYLGDPAKVTKKQWRNLGFNDSAIHLDIISTSDRIVTAYLTDGSEKEIYRKGKFVI